MTQLASIVFAGAQSKPASLSFSRAVANTQAT
jgi:hypothetical protein